MSDPVSPTRARRNVYIGAGLLAAAIIAAVTLLGGPDTPSTPEDPVRAAVDDVDAAGEGGAAATTNDGSEGTRTFTGVPDEFPAGFVPDDARDIDGTVARGAQDWSAAVTFRTAEERRELERSIDAATESAGFTRRDAIEDRERRVIRYDGADGAVLSVTLRSEGDDQLVGAVLVSG